MQFKSAKSIILCALLSGCASTGNSAVDSGINGGAGGALVGAGVGAIIGTAIKNGNVAKSAAVGGAAGLAAGAAAGVLYDAYQKQAILDANNQAIEQNKYAIVSTQRELDAYREQLDIDTMNIEPNKDLKGEIYLGHTLGNPYR